MAQQVVAIGAAVNDDTGDPLRTAFDKANDNFSELYALQSQTINAGAIEFAGAGSNENKITAAIAAAVLLGAERVFVPAAMYPYDASLVTYDTAVQMVREGGSFDVNDVRAYGAAGDGTTDDAVAIQAAMTSATTRPVYFPAGVYLVNSSLQIRVSGMRLYGIGFNGHETTTPVIGSIIKWGGAANGMMIDATPGDGSVMSSLIVRDIRIDGGSLASIGFSCGSTSTHPQHLFFQNIQFRNFATNGTDAAFDLTGGRAYGVADSEYHNCIVAGGAVGVKLNSQQNNFFGGAYSAADTGTIIELGGDSHPKFFGSGFYQGVSGEPATVFGIRTTTGIDGLECYSCWNEGQRCLLTRLDAGAAVGAYRVTFTSQRCALSSLGTDVIDLTNLSANVIWNGGFNDNTGLSRVTVPSGSSFVLHDLQAGAFTYAGAGNAIEYSATALTVRLPANADLTLLANANGDTTATRYAAASYRVGDGGVQDIIGPGFWYQTGTDQLKTTGSGGGLGWNNGANTVEIMTLSNAGGLAPLAGFGCNTKAPQGSVASGGALAAYAAGANGLSSGAEMSAMHALVVAIRSALVANGIMS